MELYIFFIKINIKKIGVNMKKDLVSIIITTYDGVESVEFAVLSALNQTYKNIEVIVVDDNGLDTENQLQTKKRLDKYINEKKILYYPHKKNMNGSAARNTGVSISTGEWVAFLDDDDIYLEQKIEKEINSLKKNNAEIVICGGLFVDKNGRGYKTIFKNKNRLLSDYLTEKVLFNTSTFLINKNSFNKLRGFDESFMRHQDWEFFTRAYINLSLSIVPENLVAKYKFGRNNASNSQIAEKYINHFFDKRGNDIFNYNAKEYKEIFDYQMLRIAKMYFYEKKYFDVKRIIKKTNYKNYSLIIIIDKVKHIVKKILFGLKKRYKSYYEVISFLTIVRSDLFNER